MTIPPNEQAPENQQPPAAVPEAPQAPQAPEAPAVPVAAPAAPGVDGPAYPGMAPAAPGMAPTPQPSTNTLAIVSLITSFIVGLVGVICGHIALGQIKRSGEKGRGIALAGTIIGYLNIASAIIGTVLFFMFAGLVANTAGAQLEQSGSSSTEEPFTEESFTDEPSADASGSDGATTPAGDYSEEFCSKLLAANNATIEATNPDGSINPEAMAIFQGLAEIPSPHQEVYQIFYQAITDPSALDATALEHLYTDYVNAVTDDVMACSSR